MTPEPIVIATQYDVSCLPEGHRARRHFTLQVRYWGDGQWSVADIYGDSYDTNGEQGASDTLRLFDIYTAMALAKRIAPTLVVNGRTVTDVLASEVER